VRTRNVTHYTWRHVYEIFGTDSEYNNNMRLAYCFAKVFKFLKITFQTDYRVHNRKADRIIAAARTAARSSNMTIRFHIDTPE